MKMSGPVDAGVLLKGRRHGMQSMRMQIGQGIQVNGKAEIHKQEQAEVPQEVNPPPRLALRGDIRSFLSPCRESRAVAGRDQGRLAVRVDGWGANTISATFSRTALQAPPS